MNQEATAGLRGLDDSEVAARLASEGFNELPRPDHRTFLKIILDVLSEPMLSLLLGGGLVYLLLGDFKEAIILLVFATLSVAITVVQETRTERVLEALRDMTSPRALVVRQGVRRRIAGREVVTDDIVLLGEGDRVPADLVLLEATDLSIDESLLTGESVPVRKRPQRADGSETSRTPGGDDLPFAYSGSIIVRGSGIGRVTATGRRSEIGKIGHSLSGLEREPPRLRAQTQRLVQIAAIAGGAVSLLAVLLYGLLRGNWLEALLAGIALGMSMLPEEFPVVLAVFMAMGAWRISQARVLTRRAAAIETLGAATVLCTDKTGTLTENRMSVVELRLPYGRAVSVRDGASIQMDDPFRELVETSVLASSPEPFDPMEMALHQLWGTIGGAPSQGLGLIKTYGLRPELLAVTQVWQAQQAQDTVRVAAKGAPEAIAGLCRLGDTDKRRLMGLVDAMAGEGLRVLAVAHAIHPRRSLPESAADFEFRLLGLVGFADPVRRTVPAAVAECRQAGIKVIMITGDYPATARAIARQAGMEAQDVITGDALAVLDDAALARRARSTALFARVMPDQKLRIVNALKADGEVVAMTGDGVNDAPSLKAAHIGVAMGGRGTDVAREASSIVLLDDDFGSIVSAVRLGRRIYDNLRKAMSFIFAVHVPIAGLALMPLVFGLPILFGPVHIALLEMVIDPVCSLVFEAETEEDDVMRRRPRDPAEPLFSRELIGWSLFQGTFALLLVGAIVWIAARKEMPEAEIRALAFFSLVLSIVGLIVVNRSFSSSLLVALRRPNPALGLVLIAVGGMLTLTLLWPPLRDLVRFGPLHADDLAVTLGAGAAVLVLLELSKRWWFGEPANVDQRGRTAG